MAPATTERRRAVLGVFGPSPIAPELIGTGGSPYGGVKCMIRPPFRRNQS
jgi:hypothetical protein